MAGDPQRSLLHPFIPSTPSVPQGEAIERNQGYESLVFGRLIDQSYGLD
jgi:hypothetical protein